MNVVCLKRTVIKALKFYRQVEDVVTDMEEMDTEFQQQQQAAGQQAAGQQTPSFSMRQLFTSTDLRRPLFVACMLQVIQQFSGINAVNILIINVDCCLGNIPNMMLLEVKPKYIILGYS